MRYRSCSTIIAKIPHPWMQSKNYNLLVTFCIQGAQKVFASETYYEYYARKSRFFLAWIYCCGTFHANIIPLWEEYSRGDICPISKRTHKVTGDEAYLRTKWHLNPSGHLATTDMGWKLGRAMPLWGGELGPHLTQCGKGRGLPACQVSSWSI